MSFADVRATIVCEGVNDSEVIKRLAEQENIDGVNLEHMGGNSGLLPTKLYSIASRRNFNALPALAVVLDANGDPVNALSTVCDELGKIVPLGQPSLKHDEVREVKWEKRVIRVGVFIMPGGGRNGALEELILPTVPADLTKCIHDFRECARKAGKGAAVKKESKKTAQALLSALPKHCINLADAAEQGMIDFNHDAFNGLKKFIRELAP